MADRFSRQGADEERGRRSPDDLQRQREERGGQGEQGRNDYERGYGAQGERGYGSQGRGSPEYGYQPPERYSGYRGSNYGYGTSGTPGTPTYQGGGYERDRAGYYGTHPREERHHEDPVRQVSRRIPWMGEGYGGPVEPVAPEPTTARRELHRPDSPRWPKSYQRSDERIREDIYERLLQDHYIDCSNVTVVVATGVVTIEGTVPDRHMKHQVENIVDDCTGVKDIDNKLRVSQVDGDRASQT